MARRVMPLLGRWPSRVFSVELDGAPCYFSIQEKHRGEEAPRLFAKVRERDRCFSLLVCAGDAIRRAKFYAELKETLLRDLPPGCDVSPMSSFLPNVRDSLIKGFFLKDSSDSPSKSEGLLRDLIRHDPVLVCSYLRGEDGQLWTQHLWSHADGQTMEMSKEYYVVPSEAPEYHPSTLNIINSDVFYSFEEAYEVMKKVLIVSLWCINLFYNYINDSHIASYARYGKMSPSCGRERYSSVHQVAHRGTWLFHLSISARWAHSGVCVHVRHRLWLPPASSHSSKLIVSVLQCGDIIPEATSVMELLPSRAPARRKPDFPVIVVEGLDATG